MSRSPPSQEGMSSQACSGGQSIPDPHSITSGLRSRELMLVSTRFQFSERMKQTASSGRPTNCTNWRSLASWSPPIILAISLMYFQNEFVLLVQSLARLFDPLPDHRFQLLCILFQALELHKPVIAISFHHKCTSLMSDMGLAEYCHDINHMNAGRLIQTSGYTWAGTNWRTFLLKNVTRSFFGLICEVRTSLSRKTSVEKPLVARAQIVCSSADLIVSPIQASALYAGMRIDTSGFVYLACASKYD